MSGRGFAFGCFSEEGEGGGGGRGGGARGGGIFVVGCCLFLFVGGGVGAWGERMIILGLKSKVGGKMKQNNKNKKK